MATSESSFLITKANQNLVSDLRRGDLLVQSLSPIWNQTVPNVLFARSIEAKLHILMEILKKKRSWGFKKSSDGWTVADVTTRVRIEPQPQAPAREGSKPAFILELPQFISLGANDHLRIDLPAGRAMRVSFTANDSPRCSFDGGKEKPVNKWESDDYLAFLQLLSEWGWNPVFQTVAPFQLGEKAASSAKGQQLPVERLLYRIREAFQGMEKVLREPSPEAGGNWSAEDVHALSRLHSQIRVWVDRQGLLADTPDADRYIHLGLTLELRNAESSPQLRMRMLLPDVVDKGPLLDSFLEQLRLGKVGDSLHKEFGKRIPLSREGVGEFLAAPHHRESALIVRVHRTQKEDRNLCLLRSSDPDLQIAFLFSTRVAGTEATIRADSITRFVWKEGSASAKNDDRGRAYNYITRLLRALRGWQGAIERTP